MSYYTDQTNSRFATPEDVEWGKELILGMILARRWGVIRVPPWYKVTLTNASFLRNEVDQEGLVTTEQIDEDQREYGVGFKGCRFQECDAIPAIELVAVMINEQVGRELE